jgi:hypothetical protein
MVCETVGHALFIENPKQCDAERIVQDEIPQADVAVANVKDVG